VPFPTKLLRRSPRLVGESLASLVFRLNSLNHYLSTSVIRRLSSPGTHDVVSRPRRAETYHSLAELTQIPADELYNATSHIFCSTLVPPGSQVPSIPLSNGRHMPLLPPVRVRALIRADDRAQYCPFCLREARYHRLIWSVIPITLCLEHRMLLWDRCPTCGSRISIAEVVAAQCEACESDLRDAPALHLSAGCRGVSSQILIQSWLDSTGDNGKDSTEYTELALSYPRHVLFRIVEGLGQVLDDRMLDRMVLPPRTSYLDSFRGVTEGYGTKEDVGPSPVPTVGKTYLRYARAIAAIRNWPYGFHTFLAEYSGIRPEHPSGKPAEDFGSLYTRWLERHWRKPEFAFVQEAFNVFLTAHYLPSSALIRTSRFRRTPKLIEDFAYVNIQQACRILGVSTRTLNHLVACGYLTGYGSHNGNSGQFQALLRSDVERLHMRWADAMNLSETSTALGLSDPIVVEMVRCGLIRADRGPDIDDSAQWLFVPTQIEACLKRINRNVCIPGNLPQDAVDLIVASKMLAVVGLNAVGVLQAVADGRLVGYYAPHTVSPGDMFFRPVDLEAYVEREKQRRGWVTRDEIARRMGVKVTVISQWVGNGCITPATSIGTTDYFDAEAVERFVKAHVYTQEAAELLDVGVLTVQRWARQGRLSPVAGPGVDDTHRYLFRRADIARLRPERRLSAPEMAERLGISHSQLVAWIKIGKVEPISGPGIDECGNYLFVKEDGKTFTDPDMNN
jgi:hypothetical protein